MANIKSDKLGRPTTKRGSATYHKVISAGIQCICEAGFHNASTNKIAKAAGVTWGTLQHQFGDKARLLEAILEFCFDEQMQQISLAMPTGQSLERRVDAFIEAVWRNQQTNSSRALQEILLGVQGDPELRERFSPTLLKLRNLYDDQWQEFFADVDLPKQRMEAVKELTFCTLRGLAADITIRSSDGPIQMAKALLKTAVVNIFSGKA